MPYDKWIDSRNPTCLIFTIDQSLSMEEQCAGEAGRNKAQKLADAVNSLFKELTIRCTQGEVIKDYFEIGLIGYGSQVGPAWCQAKNSGDDGYLANNNKDLVWISELGVHPVRVDTRQADNGVGAIVSVKMPVWIDPQASNGTPMGKAMERAYGILESWVQQHPDSYPPTVINITDGEPNGDPDPLQVVNRIRQLQTNNGNVLVFNLHLSKNAGTPILYPESDAGLPDQYARQLFEMSSVVPPRFVAEAVKEGMPVTEQSRGFVFQANGLELIKFLDLGTRQLPSPATDR